MPKIKGAYFPTILGQGAPSSNGKMRDLYRRSTRRVQYPEIRRSENRLARRPVWEIALVNWKEQRGPPTGKARAIATAETEGQRQMI